jgi:superfamily II RNA helicase
MMRSRWEGAPEAFTLVMKQPDALTSKFAPNYAMVINPNPTLNPKPETLNPNP